VNNTTKKDPYVFDPSDVEFSVEMPAFLDNKKINDVLDSLVIRFVPLIRYIQAPLLKLFKHLGGSIGRLTGLGKPEYDVIQLKEVLISTQDGAKLPTDVYLPKPVFRERYKAPTILIRLPYWKKMLSIVGYILASKGYVTVLQDIRGCASAIPYGTLAFTYFIRSDGFSTLEWLKKRFWYNGRIGMWGLSFLGVTQLAISWDNQGVLTCLSPGQCSYTSVLYHTGGLTPLGMAISILRLVLGITQNVEPALTTMMKGEEGISEALYLNPLMSLYNDPIDSKRYLLHLKDLAKVSDPDALTKLLNKTYNLNLKFNEKDTGELPKFLKEAVLARRLNMNYEHLPYAFNFTPEKIDTPMLVISSWYDLFVEQILRDTKIIQEKSPEYFRKNYKLIICPGAHGGMDMFPRGFPGKLPDLKTMLALYQNFVPIWWYDYFLKRKGTDLSKVPPIRLYVLNRGIWRNFEQWPPVTKPLKLYLHSHWGAGALLEVDPKPTLPHEYAFNPANPVVTRGGRFLTVRSGGLNQTKIELRKDVLVYTSRKLETGLEVIGDVKIVLYASSTAKDTDFMVKLVDVFNTRKAINIVDSGIRARFREGLDKPSFIEPDKIYKYEITIGAIGYYFPKGHKIRIEISSSNFPRFDVNSNLAGEQNEKGYITAQQKIFHDLQNPSHLILPIFKKY